MQGFHSLNGDFIRDIEIAVVKDGKDISKIKEIAKDNSLALAFGYIEREDDSIFSSYLVIDDFKTACFGCDFD